MWGDVPLRLTNPTELNAKTFGLAKVQTYLYPSKERFNRRYRRFTS
jgi:hypothetical protein